MIYAIVGPTGVGKTKLSIMLAKKLNAEIVIVNKYIKNYQLELLRLKKKKKKELYII